jgi:hypothetical protein
MKKQGAKLENLMVWQNDYRPTNLCLQPTAYLRHSPNLKPILRLF